MSKQAKLRVRRRRSERLRVSYGKFSSDYLYKKMDGEYLVPTVQELGFADIIQGLIPQNFGDEELKSLWGSGTTVIRESQGYWAIIEQLRGHPDWVISNYLGNCGARLSEEMFSDIFRCVAHGPGEMYDPMYDPFF